MHAMLPVSEWYAVLIARAKDSYIPALTVTALAALTLSLSFWTTSQTKRERRLRLRAEQSRVMAALATVTNRARLVKAEAISHGSLCCYYALQYRILYGDDNVISRWTCTACYKQWQLVFDDDGRAGWEEDVSSYT